MGKDKLRVLGTALVCAAVCISFANAQEIKSGAAIKKPVFGGSGPNAGWGSLGAITKEAMKFYGWDVQICTACAGAERASRLVAAAAIPPRGGPNEPPQPVTPLDFGATGSQYLWWAYQGSHGFMKDPEGPRKQLRLIANIQSPSYLVVAVKADSAITDLAQIKEKRLPVRILTLMRDGAIRRVSQVMGVRSWTIIDPDDRCPLGMRDIPNTRLLTGRQEPKMLIDLVRGAAVVVGVSTALSHLAALTGTPALVVEHPTTLPEMYRAPVSFVRYIRPAKPWWIDNPSNDDVDRAMAEPDNTYGFVDGEWRDAIEKAIAQPAFAAQLN